MLTVWGVINCAKKFKFPRLRLFVSGKRYISQEEVVEMETPDHCKKYHLSTQCLKLNTNSWSNNSNPTVHMQETENRQQNQSGHSRT